MVNPSPFRPPGDDHFRTDILADTDLLGSSGQVAPAGGTGCGVRGVSTADRTGISHNPGLPEGVQVRVLEESSDTIYLVLPSASVVGGSLSDEDLEAVAGAYAGATRKAALRLPLTQQV